MSERNWFNQECSEFSKFFVSVIATFAEELFPFGPRNNQLNFFQ